MLGKIFLKGLKTILPLAITLAIVIWILDVFERFFKELLIAFIGPQNYFSGLGLIVGLVFVFLIGIIMNAWIVQKIYDYGDKLLKRIPLIKSLYGAIQDIMNFVKSHKDSDEHQVVMVNISGAKIMGFITRKDFNDLPNGIGDEKDIAVYLPMSYQIGGYTIIVPKDCVKPIDMSVEKAMRFAVTAGMLVTSDEPSSINEEQKHD
jgi:uncharacterized membrane protein